MRTAAAVLPHGVHLDMRPSKEQIDRVVAKITNTDTQDLRRASDNARLQVGFDEDGYVLGIDNEACADGVMAAVSKIIAYSGCRRPAYR